MGTGDRPIFPLLNQRLDKKDLNAISTYIQAMVNRSLGSVLSGNGGLMTTLEYALTYASPTEVAVSFSAFRAAWSAPLDGDPSVFDGGVMTFDPTRPAQVTSSWPIEAFQGQGTIFWAKRLASNTVTDNRAYWQGGTKYSATVTVESEYVEVVPRLASAGPPDAEFGWVQIAYIQVSGWSGFTPTIKPIYFPDAKHFNSGAGPGTPNWWSLYDPDVSGGGNPGVALGDQLRWIFNVISRIIDSGWAFEADGRVDSGANNGVRGWQDAPVRGLDQIDTALDVQQGEIDGLDTRVTVLEGADTFGTTAQLALVLEFRWNAGTVQYDKVTVYSNGAFTSSHATVQRGVLGVGHGVQATVVSTGSGAYTIYSVSGQALGTEGSGGDPDATNDQFNAQVRYPSAALPGTSAVFDIYEQDGVNHPRLLLSVWGGRTP